MKTSCNRTYASTPRDLHLQKQKCTSLLSSLLLSVQNPLSKCRVHLCTQASVLICYLTYLVYSSASSSNSWWYYFLLEPVLTGTGTTSVIAQSSRKMPATSHDLVLFNRSSKKMVCTIPGRSWLCSQCQHLNCNLRVDIL